MSEQKTDQSEADEKTSGAGDAEQKDDGDAEQKDDGDAEQKKGDQGDDVERYDSGQIKEAPEPSDEQKGDAEEMAKSYIEDRPTTVLPGSDGTVTGTAVNDWIDDDGNPVHGDIDDNLQEAAERDRERNEKAQASKDEDDAKEDDEEPNKGEDDSSKDEHEDSSKDQKESNEDAD